MNKLRDITSLEYYDVTKDNPLIMKLETSKRKKLYHYTTNIGAKGILESNSLWISHSNYLDDTKEIKYISFVLEGVIRYLSESKELYDIGIDGQLYVYEAIIKTLEALKEIYKYGAPITGGNLFLLSLTENKNNKFLLKNYCGRYGAVLEFENNIDDRFKENKNVLSIFKAKVEYDLGRQITLLLEDINEFYSELLANLVSKKDVDYIETIETIKSIIYIKIINYSFFFKHFSFSKEEEYRMVFLVGEDSNNKFVKYRMKTDRKIPYIEVNFNQKSLTKVRFI